MQQPVLLIIGPPRHGKTEARKLLAELTFMRGESTSTVIYKFLSVRRNVSAESLLQLPKESLRPDLIEAGDFLVGAIDKIAAPAANPAVEKEVYRIPSTLVRTLYLSGYNIIDGVRRKAELTDSVKHLEWNGVRSIVLWIFNPNADLIKDNTELTAADATDIIVNDGTREELRTQLKLTVEKHFGKQPEKPEPIPVFDAPEDAVAAVKAQPANEL